ncbi:MAG: hypothetical protein QOH41_2554 [Blastocatellia bacterium]|jgi:hypothetical protein|nr:hypothetical protein [Blastocatellia bacterium]
MADRNREATDLRGAFAYENWRAALSHEPLSSVYEHPLFSDTHFSISRDLQTRFGPYLLYNTQSRGISTTQPSFILRIDYHHVDRKMPDLGTTDVSRFHGGGVEDELAALLSLNLRVRLKAGAMTRLFLPGGTDPKGQPFVPHKGNPILVKRPYGDPMLPHVIDMHDPSEATLVNRFPHLSPIESIALVRAARLYQDAVWIAEAEPQSSWLLLVSAAETAANHWRAANETAVERLRTSRPELAELLVNVGGQEHLSQVADLIADYMGATRKFLDFLIEFMPDAPEPRPRAYDQHSWEHVALKKSLRTIYGWRSRALHGGTPIPSPMCDEPIRSGNGWSEVMVGYGAGAYGGVWTARDAPMKLHLFEYIVRGALIKWWDSMLPLTALPKAQTEPKL